jgi:hypothetical protein
MMPGSRVGLFRKETSDNVALHCGNNKCDPRLQPTNSARYIPRRKITEKQFRNTAIRRMHQGEPTDVPGNAVGAVRTKVVAAQDA